jgi:hypothetical protein
LIFNTFLRYCIDLSIVYNISGCNGYNEEFLRNVWNYNREFTWGSKRKVKNWGHMIHKLQTAYASDLKCRIIIRFVCLITPITSLMSQAFACEESLYISWHVTYACVNESAKWLCTGVSKSQMAEACTLWRLQNRLANSHFVWQGSTKSSSYLNVWWN